MVVVVVVVVGDGGVAHHRMVSVHARDASRSGRRAHARMSNVLLLCGCACPDDASFTSGQEYHKSKALRFLSLILNSYTLSSILY